MNHHVRITTAGVRGTVHIDDHDISAAVVGVRFSGGVDEIAEAHLDLCFFVGEIDGEVQVHLPDETRVALIALGWTPPKT